MVARFDCDGTTYAKIVFVGTNKSNFNGITTMRVNCITAQTACLHSSFRGWEWAYGTTLDESLVDEERL